MSAKIVTLDSGPFRIIVRSNDRAFVDFIRSFYRDSLLDHGPLVVDYVVSVMRPRTMRRWLRPQALFEIDGIRPFEPHPLENAFPMYEWGLNWCIGTSAHRYLMLHAGCIAFDGQAMIFPGTPGSGKSTLSAALHLCGARLLSDEFGLVRPEKGDLLPMPRGIPLKNDSIEAIIEFDGSAQLGPTYPNTRKGRVRHLRPSANSLASQHVPAMPRWLVFPKYKAGAPESLKPVDKVRAFRQLAENSFNFRLLGEAAFRAVGEIVSQVDCYTFTFSSLNKATDQLIALTEGQSAEAAAEA